MDSTIEIKCLDDLVRFGNTAREKFGYNALWYRGHRKESWKLVPNVFRDRTLAEAMSYELRLVRKFRARAHLRHDTCPDNDDWFAWLSLMRQYELPNRLLDWSESPLVAAYFATVSSDPGQSAAIWTLDPTKLKYNFGDDSEPATDVPEAGKSLMYRYAGAAFRGQAAETGNGSVVPMVRRETSLRMLVQRSAFTLHSVLQPLETQAAANDCLQRATIPANAKDKLRSDLAALGIDRAALFPDLEWMSRGLAESESPPSPAN